MEKVNMKIDKVNMNYEKAYEGISIPRLDAFNLLLLLFPRNSLKRQPQELLKAVA